MAEHKAGIEQVTGHRQGSGCGQGSGHEFGLGINKLSLYVFINIDFDAVDECEPSALYCVLNVRTQ